MPSPLNVSGIDFPFRIGEQSFPKRVVGSSAIISSVKSLLFTGRGEVPMQPRLGTSIHDFVFEEMTPIRKDLLATEVRRVLKENIPKMNVLSIEVTNVEDSVLEGGGRGTKVNVNIVFAVSGQVDSVSVGF